MPTFQHPTTNEPRHSHDFPDACVANLSAKWFEQFRASLREEERLFNNSLSNMIRLKRGLNYEIPSFFLSYFLSFFFFFFSFLIGKSKVRVAVKNSRRANGEGPVINP